MRSFLIRILAVICLAASLIPASAQNQNGQGQNGQGQNGSSAETHPGTPPSQPYQSQAPDSQLKQLLGQINQNNLQTTVQTLVNFGTRHTASSQTDPVRGIGAATNWVYNQLQTYAASSGGNMTVQKQSFVQPVVPGRIPVPTTITNVIATVQGTESPERAYVIVAHLDDRVTDVLNFTSDAPGADAGASGVAVVLELARVMAAQAPHGTMVFSVVAGEEQGLFGSTYEAEQMAAAGMDVEGVFSVDNIGSSVAQDGTKDPYELRLFTEGIPTNVTANQIALMQAVGGEDDSSSRELGRFAKSVAENNSTGMTIWLIKRRDRILGAGDQISFSGQGFPAAKFAEPNENFDHERVDVQVVNGVQFGDLTMFLDYAFMARVARVNAATIWSLAEGPGTPKGVELHIVPPTGLVGTNATNLTWLGVADPNLAGYEVVWRNMDDSDWTHVIPVGNVNAISFPFFPADNFIMGVRSVDTSGHYSPVAYPTIVTF